MTDYFMRAICFDVITATQSIEFRIMPNYEYECDGEGLSIVLDLSMEHEIPCCQVCGAKLRRVYTAVPTIFKGSGWAGKDG
jgi:putative FmdB family regulatory protein